MNTNPIIIIDDHLDGRTLAYNGWVMHGHRFFNANDPDDVAKALKSYVISNNTWQQVLDAIETGESKISGHNNGPFSFAEFAYEYSVRVDLLPPLSQRL